MTVTPSDIGAGDTVSARVGVYNRGSSAAGHFWVMWRYGEGDFDGCSWEIASMSAHGGRVLTCDADIYTSYNTTVTVDTNFEVNEAVESNNSRSYLVTVH